MHNDYHTTDYHHCCSRARHHDNTLSAIYHFLRRQCPRVCKISGTSSTQCSNWASCHLFFKRFNRRSKSLHTGTYQYCGRNNLVYVPGTNSILSNSDLLNWQNWRNIEIPSSIFVILVAARWMFAYALASNTCSETTNMDDGISMFLTVVSEVKSEFMLERFGEEDRRCRSSGKWNSIGLTLEPVP